MSARVKPGMRTQTPVARAATALGAALLVLGLCGCASQLAGLAPVGGDSVTSVRTAAIDVLLDKGVDVLQAPSCVESVERFTCTGSTIDGRPITVDATIAKPHQMTVAVDGTVLFTGLVQDVIDQAARSDS